MRHGSMTVRPSMAVMLAAVLLAVSPVVDAQMPDARAMSGLAMPTSDLPDGTVSVRVVRGSMTNNLSGIRVELHGAGPARAETTGADGRAQFTGLPTGARVHAHAVHEGERLETSEFEVPATGGIRSLLVFSEPGQAAAPPPASRDVEATAAPGAVPAGAEGLSIGGNSRVVLEFREDVLQVFYLLEILNRTGEPITPPSALIFDMPRGAEGTTLLEGATTQANARGTRVTVTGPFQPGVTPLPVAFRFDAFGSTVSLEQRFPLPFEMVAIAVQKVGDMQVSSPQVARTQETPIESSVFLMGNGPRLEAGHPFTLQLTGVPHHDRTPVYLALVLAAALVGLAAWMAIRPGGHDAAAARRRTLETRRERDLAALVTLERQYRAGGIDESRYADRRAMLVTRLESVYGELDESGAAPGGHGAAA
jgi:hypothetical protein